MPQTLSNSSQIQIVPYGKENIFLPPFKSRTSWHNVSLFSEYRSIRGIINYSKNYRALYLYSGMLGAFLEIHIDLSENRWYHPSLPAACEWLQQHNLYLR